MQTIFTFKNAHHSTKATAAQQCGTDWNFFSKEKELEVAARKIKGVKWSQTHRCWYVPMLKENYQLLHNQFKNKAHVGVEALKLFLHKRKVVTATVPHTDDKLAKPAVYDVNFR